MDLPGLGGLDVWWVGGYGGGLFLPMRDATSGAASYGAGRYVLDTVKGADLGGDPDPLWDLRAKRPMTWSAGYGTMNP